MMILATVRPLGDFDGNPLQTNIIVLTWVERSLGSEAMNCVSQKQLVPALSHLQTSDIPLKRWPKYSLKIYVLAKSRW